MESCPSSPSTLSSTQLYDLPDYSGYEPALVLQDLRSRTAAARRAQSRYLETRDHLSSRLAKLSEDTASVIRLLEARNSELSAIKQEWIDSMSNSPPIDKLETMLFNLRTRVVARTASELLATSVLAVAPFVAMGVLQEGDTLALLPAKIDALLAKRQRHPRGGGRALTPLAREASLLRSLHTLEGERAREEIEGWRSDLIQTQQAVKGEALSHRN
jgi:hypothetical protein